MIMSHKKLLYYYVYDDMMSLLGSPIGAYANCYKNWKTGSCWQRIGGGIVMKLTLEVL